jgi:hypothetical protein
VLECGNFAAIPEFGNLSEVNPFEFSFTKNFSSALPMTSNAAFKTPDGFSIFKYIATTPVPQPFAPTPPPSDTEHMEVATEKPSVGQDDQNVTQVVSKTSPQDLSKVNSDEPVVDLESRDSTATPPIKEEDLIMTDSPKQRDQTVKEVSSPSRKQSTASSDWQEYERFDRSGSADSDLSSTSSLGLKRKPSSPSKDNEDPETKRRRFLERNRMAASKCRQKKKKWMQELEHREEEIDRRNKALHALVSDLKEEVLILKNQLLSHHNCNCNVIQQYVQTSGHFNMPLVGVLNSRISAVPPQMSSVHLPLPQQALQHPQYHPQQLQQHPHHHQHHVIPPREMIYGH